MHENSTSENAPAESEEGSTAAKLIEVAGEIFAEKGPSATVREICSAAGCSVASINYYFGDKRQLYQQCVKTACERKQKLFPLPNLDAAELSSAEQALKGFLQGITRRLIGKIDQDSAVSEPWYNVLLLREVIQPSDGVEELLREAFRKDFGTLHALVGNLLGVGLDSNSLRSELATQILARVMFLRTGKSLRKMVGLDTNTNECAEAYADSIYRSVLAEIQHLRTQAGSAALPLSENFVNNNSGSGVEQARG